MANKIYTKSIKCAICGDVVEETEDKNFRHRTVKSWYNVCMACFRHIDRRISNLEKYLA